jgi:hypothetical protein
MGQSVFLDPSFVIQCGFMKGASRLDSLLLDAIFSPPVRHVNAHTKLTARADWLLDSEDYHANSVRVGTATAVAGASA